MNDVFDAIERLSAELSERIGRLAGERGWAYKPYSWMIANGDKPVLIVNTTLMLPGGYYAAFTPRIEPSGNVWPIDVRRTDGVARPGWSSGLRVEKGAGGWTLSAEAGPLTDDKLAALLEDLGSA